MVRWMIGALTLAGSPAFANTICVVDFQSAITQTNEGKSAQKKLDGMTSSRKRDLEGKQAAFETAVKDYEKRAPTLSETARRQEEQKLMAQQAQLNQAIAGAEQEMQQTYLSLLGDLDGKLRKIMVSVGSSSGCTVVLDRAAVVYNASSVRDVTTTLVGAYNRKYPGN